MKRSLSQLTVAVVGLGSIGRRHIENLCQLGIGRLVIVRRKQGANGFFRAPADAAVVHSHRQAMAEGLDLAIVCNPTRLHAETALEYVCGGVPVLVEKPVSDDLHNAEQLHKVAQELQIPCGMAYCLRHHPAYAITQEAIARGKLGQVQSARAWFDSYLPDWHPWEDYRQSYAARPELGGGVLPTLDHEIDFFNWCFGAATDAERTDVHSGFLDSPVDDLARLRLAYAQGVSAEIELSFCRMRRQRGFEISGTQGLLHFDFDDAQLTFEPAAAGPEHVLWNQDNYDPNDMYRDLLSHALQSVLDKRPFPIPLAAGVATLEVMIHARVGALR